MILIISDIHSHFKNLKKVLERENPDLVLVCGDITDFNPRDIPVFDKILKDYDCLAVHGNCDDDRCVELLESAENIKFIHGKSVRVGDYTFYGLGGSTPTPFFTPSEYSENYYYELLRKFNYEDNSVLITHSPPYGILDRTYRGVNTGSKAIRDFLEKFDYVFCGHIHESYGIMRVSKTTVVNAGCLADGIYVKTDFKDFTFCRV